MIRAIIALLASIVTAIQAILIYTGGQTICFNSGCEIVDSLTVVSPLYFNIAGLIYFQVLFWCLLWGRDGAEFWHKFARLLLLAGLCVEGVLVSFQYSVAAVFCSYCLVILSFIVLLNLLSGVRQLFRGAFLFSAVLVSFFSLQLGPKANSGNSLNDGSLAAVVTGGKEHQLYLFFSSSCAHCEKVIESLQEENDCNVRFNPVERIDSFAFPGAKLFAEYSPEYNIGFLKSLSIEKIPVLVAADPKKTLVLEGEQRIVKYLNENCRESVPMEYSGTSSIPPDEAPVTPAWGGQVDDACSVATDCEPEPVEEVQGKN